VGNVGQGAVVDFAIFAVGLAQQDGGRGGAVGDHRDIQVYMFARLVRYCKHNLPYYMTTQARPNPVNSRNTKGFT
jgi:hypothetical protein